MNIARYMLRRFGQVLVILTLIGCLNFIVLKLAPGDLVDVLAGESGASDEAYLKNFRALYGLDQSVVLQLMHYLLGIARFNLGFSFRYNLPVIDLIFSRFPATLLLMLTSLSLALMGGIVLGVTAARRPGSAKDTVHFGAVAAGLFDAAVLGRPDADRLVFGKTRLAAERWHTDRRQRSGFSRRGRRRAPAL